MFDKCHPHFEITTSARETIKSTGPTNVLFLRYILRGTFQIITAFSLKVLYIVCTVNKIATFLCYN